MFKLPGHDYVLPNSSYQHSYRSIRGTTKQLYPKYLMNSQFHWLLNISGELAKFESSNLIWENYGSQKGYKIAVCMEKTYLNQKRLYCYFQIQISQECNPHEIEIETCTSIRFQFQWAIISHAFLPIFLPFNQMIIEKMNKESLIWK